MKHSNAIYWSVALVFLIGCVHAATLNRSEIRTMRDQSRLRSMGLSVHYCGSTNGFDYFRAWNPGAGSIGREEWYKVPESEGSVATRFPFTKKRELWLPYNE